MAASLALQRLLWLARARGYSSELGSATRQRHPLTKTFR